MINARAETALEKKLFRDSVLHRRCIIPAKQFYEWDEDAFVEFALHKTMPQLVRRQEYEQQRLFQFM